MSQKKVKMWTIDNRHGTNLGVGKMATYIEGPISEEYNSYKKRFKNTS